MKINSPRRRKAISPVLATVILIAITLIAAIAIAGFVFGLFGTFTSGANLQLSTQGCYNTAGSAPANATSKNNCYLAVTNTGGASGSITGCSIYGTTGAVGKDGAHGTPAAGTVVVPAGTTSGKPVVAVCTAAASTTLTSGAAVSGQLVVASGSPLAFSAISS